MDTTPVAPKPVPLHLLEEITNGFSRDRKLGGGTYGDVYQYDLSSLSGEHKDGQKIAVKVLKDGIDLGDEQFEKEYHNLASLHHKNVVRLVGYCHETKKECMPYNGRMVFAEKTKRVLCFEYMHNGSLGNFIYDKSNRHNWRTRYAIIKGICEGLEYLHEKLEPSMYHLDLKPANVLLDENMSAKIADFGVSRLFLEEKTRKTNSVLGTFGYIPPEYINEGLISIKFDIFSLGVVIIKMMTGRKGYSRITEMSSQQFIEHVHTKWMNRLQSISVHRYSVQVRRCIEIALSCVEAERHKRPSIGVIVNTLNKTESWVQIPDALRNDLDSSINQLCPCITTDRKMLDILKEKLISYQLRITDNRSMPHLVTITTACDPEVGTSKSEPVRPRIKIIDYMEGLSEAASMDAHSTKPWILLGHYGGQVSVWNHQNQTRVMAFHLNSDGEFAGLFHVGAAKFIEPLQVFVAHDSVGFIHVYSYEKVEKLQKFRAHTENVTSLAVHPSEPLVLSASDDNLIKLWDWEAGWQCIRTFEGHSDWVLQVKFNPHTAGNTFASCSGDSTIKMWNMDSPTPVASFVCDQGFAFTLDYFCHGGALQYLVARTAVKGSAQILDLQSNTCIKNINRLQRYGRNIAVVERPSGRPILLTVSEDHTVAFCDSTTHRYENRVNFNLGLVMDFAYITMTKSLVVLCRNGIAIVEIN
nr:probable LRR receptor-like serine/threonine-protein kinase At1g53430 [Lolium perenne]